MVSKKLLLMTFFALSCAANSSLAMGDNFLLKINLYAQHAFADRVTVNKKNPALKKLVLACAREAVADEAEGNHGKRRYRKLVAKVTDRALQNRVDFAERRTTVTTVVKEFDAACKQIEERHFFASTEQAYAAQNKLQNAPALNVYDLNDAARAHAQLIEHDPMNLQKPFMRTVEHAINKQALRIPVAFRPQFIKRTKQEYAKKVKKAVKRLED